MAVELDFRDWRLVNQLLLKYVTAIESDDYEMLGTCFTHDIELDLSDAIGESLEPVHGRQAAVDTIRRQRASLGTMPRRHLISNVIIQEADGDTVTCACVLQLVVTPPNGDARISLTGQYLDVIRRSESEGWQLARRQLLLDSPITPSL